MRKFKQKWEISKNWQLLYPLFGVLGLLYSAFKLSILIFKDSTLLNIIGTAILFFILLKLTVFILKKLEKRWIVEERWQITRIFIIFAITGTTSLYVTTPIFNAIGFTKDAFSANTFYLIIYYILKFFAILPFYKILLVVFGWTFGEFKFFYAFTIKMLNRFRLKKSTKE